MTFIENHIRTDVEIGKEKAQDEPSSSMLAAIIHLNRVGGRKLRDSPLKRAEAGELLIVGLVVVWRTAPMVRNVFAPAVQVSDRFTNEGVKGTFGLAILVLRRLHRVCS